MLNDLLKATHLEERKPELESMLFFFFLTAVH